ncbi:MAG: HAD-IIB family hydrolase [Betaproteobacteria bacterium]|nr:MAG: HAD-IIB family hydrolase [Betaproteobacteria bacterium]
MKPLAELDARGVRALLFDLDDTLSTAGRITAQAYGALERLHAAGTRTVAVTGRPAGWCDHVARMWPVDAVVGENGAFYFRHAGGRLRREYHEAPERRARHRERLAQIARQIIAAVPGCAIAADQAYRETDLAIDYCEDVAPLPLGEAERIAALMRSAGLHAKVSSIHVNGWFGDYDKLAMTRRLFQQEFGIVLERERAAVLYVGDSPNDAPMFEFFPRSVGVANVRRFGALLATAPKYITVASSGAGFAELVAHLLAA